IVATFQGRPVRIRDIGRVENGNAEPRGLARLNGSNAVSLIVRKQSGTNVVSVVDDVRAALLADDQADGVGAVQTGQPARLGIAVLDPADVADAHGTALEGRDD